MNLRPEDWQALGLTFQLAAVTSLSLVLLTLPLAWWLARSRFWLADLVNAVVALPLVLPPTVLGFYLLLLLGPHGPLGALWVQVTGRPLAFTFAGLVLGSMIYSLPFAVQPLRDAFRALDDDVLDAADGLGASPLDRFLSVVLPMAWPGVVTALVLSFAHTVGEFGVIVMIGGSLPGETLVASVAVFEYVESSQSGRAHGLAIVLLLVSFTLLVPVYLLDGWRRRRAA